MAEQRRSISEALRRGRWAALKEELRRLWWMLALSVIALAGVIYWNASPRIVVGAVYGVASGAHQLQSETGQGATQVSVTLDDGRVVAVSLPRGLAFKHDARMKIEVQERAWPPRASIYRFVGYVEEAEGR